MEQEIRSLQIDEVTEIEEAVPRIICEVIERNTPYHWFYTEEPYTNFYGKFRYDRSGDVEKMSKGKLIEINKKISEEGIPHWAQSELQYFLDLIHINSWQATYESGCGKSWISYMELVWSELEDWKFKNFELNDENGEDINEELGDEVTAMFYELVDSYSYKYYYQKVMHTIE